MGAAPQPELETAAVKDARFEEPRRPRKFGDDDDDDDDEEIGRYKRITPKVLKKLIKEQKMYNTPSLNDKLYLHYHGFVKLEGLEAWTGCARTHTHVAAYARQARACACECGL